MVKVAVETLAAQVLEALTEWERALNDTYQFLRSLNIPPAPYLQPPTLPVVLYASRSYIDVTDYFVVTTLLGAGGPYEAARQWVKVETPVKVGLIFIAEMLDYRLRYWQTTFNSSNGLVGAEEAARKIASTLSLPFVATIKEFIKGEIERMAAIKREIEAYAETLMESEELREWAAKTALERAQQ